MRPVPQVILLGAEAHDPSGLYQGRIVAVFLNRLAAVKWGACDAEYTRPRTSPEQRFAILHDVHRGDVLLPAEYVRYGPRPAPERVITIDPALVRRDYPPPPPPPPPARRKSALRRRRPVIGVGG